MRDWVRDLIITNSLARARCGDLYDDPGRREYHTIDKRIIIQTLDEIKSLEVNCSLVDTGKMLFNVHLTFLPKAVLVSSTFAIIHCNERYRQLQWNVIVFNISHVPRSTTKMISTQCRIK